MLAAAAPQHREAASRKNMNMLASVARRRSCPDNGPVDMLLGTVVSVDRSSSESQSHRPVQEHDSISSAISKEPAHELEQKTSVRFGDYVVASTAYVKDLRSSSPHCIVCKQETGTNVARTTGSQQHPLLQQHQSRHWECVVVVCQHCEDNHECLACSGCVDRIECRSCEQKAVAIQRYGSIELLLQRVLDRGYDIRSVAPDKAQLKRQIQKAFPEGRTAEHERVVAFPFGTMLFSCISAQKADAQRLLRGLFVEPPVAEFTCPVCDEQSFPSFLLMKIHQEACCQNMDEDDFGACLMNGPIAFYLSPECIDYLQDLHQCRNVEGRKLALLNDTALPLQTAGFSLVELAEVKKAQQQVITTFFTSKSLAMRRVSVRVTLQDLASRLLNSWKNKRRHCFPPFLILPFLLDEEPRDTKAIGSQQQSHGSVE